MKKAEGDEQPQAREQAAESIPWPEKDPCRPLQNTSSVEEGSSVEGCEGLAARQAEQQVLALSSGSASTGPAPSQRDRGASRGRGRGLRGGRAGSAAHALPAPFTLQAGRAAGAQDAGGNVVEVDGVPKVLPGVSMEASLEVRRRMAAFQAMLLLLEHGASGEAEFMKRATPLSGQELMQVV